MRFARLGSTVIDGHWLHYYNYWRFENLQSLGIFRISDILSYYRRLHCQAADISPLVADGEIKSTGKQVSIDDVLNRIDKALEANDEE